MNHAIATTRPNTLHLVLRWSARITSAATIAILALFAFGGGEPGLPNAREVVLLLFFPVGLIVGLVLGWWRERAGGILALASMGGFYAVYGAMHGGLPRGPYFAILAVPAVLFVVAGMVDRRGRAG